MKKIIFSISFSILVSSLFGQHEIEVMKYFEKNHQTSKVLLQFDLDQDLTVDELSAINQWTNDNKQILEFSKEGNRIILSVAISAFEKSVYLKAFIMMNITSIKEEGNKTISVEEFLSKNNL